MAEHRYSTTQNVPNNTRRTMHEYQQVNSIKQSIRYPSLNPLPRPAKRVRGSIQSSYSDECEYVTEFYWLSWSYWKGIMLGWLFRLLRFKQGSDFCFPFSTSAIQCKICSSLFALTSWIYVSSLLLNLFLLATKIHVKLWTESYIIFLLLRQFSVQFVLLFLRFLAEFPFPSCC